MTSSGTFKIDGFRPSASWSRTKLTSRACGHGARRNRARARATDQRAFGRATGESGARVPVARLQASLSHGQAFFAAVPLRALLCSPQDYPGAAGVCGGQSRATAYQGCGVSWMPVCRGGAITLRAKRAACSGPFGQSTRRTRGHHLRAARLSWRDTTCGAGTPHGEGPHLRGRNASRGGIQPPGQGLLMWRDPTCGAWTPHVERPRIQGGDAPSGGTSQVVAVPMLKLPLVSGAAAGAEALAVPPPGRGSGAVGRP